MSLIQINLTQCLALNANHRIPYSHMNFQVGLQKSLDDSFESFINGYFVYEVFCQKNEIILSFKLICLLHIKGYKIPNLHSDLVEVILLIRYLFII
jgi:hypothetical protein